MLSIRSHCTRPAAFWASIFAAQPPPTSAMSTFAPVSFENGSTMLFWVASLKMPPPEAITNWLSAAWDPRGRGSVNATGAAGGRKVSPPIIPSCRLLAPLPHRFSLLVWFELGRPPLEGCLHPLLPLDIVELPILGRLHGVEQGRGIQPGLER